MQAITKKIIKNLQFVFRPKNYYHNLLISNDNQFNEYIECINYDIGKNNDDNGDLVLEDLRDKIFNLVCDIMIKKRDYFLIRIDKEFNLRNIVRIRIFFFLYFYILNMLIFYFLPNYEGEYSTFLETLWDSLWFSIFETIYVLIIDIVFYRILYKSIRNRLNKYCYDIYDEDIKEYYDTRGESVFGAKFLTDFDGSDNEFKIQLFKDKVSSQLNSVCVLKPITVIDDKIIMSIGFMGTLTDKKLKYTILNKMVDTLDIEFNLLKDGNPDKKVQLEIVSRGIDTDILTFLVKYKGFKKDKVVSNDFKFYKGFNKIRYIKT
ncbi:hypothetical protein ACO0SA_004012 [Hanseniaspora valbyensis]